MGSKNREDKLLKARKKAHKASKDTTMSEQIARAVDQMLSQEFVGDDDDSDVLPAEIPSPKPANDQIKVDSKPTASKVIKADTAKESRTLASRFISSATKKDSLEERTSFNQGTFSKLERQAIEVALNNFLDEHQIPQGDLPLLLHRKSKASIMPGIAGDNIMNQYASKEYVGFVSAVREASGLNRTVDQVYYYLSRAYSEVRTPYKKWTKDQDRQLLALYNAKGPRWREISLELGMTDVRSRFSKIGYSNDLGRWKKDELDRFAICVAELTKKYDCKPLAFNYWVELSAMLGTRTPTQCRSKWMNHAGKDMNSTQVIPGNREFDECDTLVLIERMASMCQNAADEDEVDWDRLVGEGEPWTGSILRAMWYKVRVRLTALHLQTMDFQGISQS